MPRFNHITFRLLVTFLLVTALSGTITFAQTDDPPNTQKLEIPFTPPDKALEMLSLPEGFSATLFASEPDVHQPIAVTTDHRGRLWVVECYTYSDGKTNYDMSLNDRVVIFEDDDNDGRFDKKTVFWDEGKKLTGIELGYGGVWLTAAPEFIFVPDADGDDKPDGPPYVLLDGFEDNTIRHNIVNGLRWGPDGWLYGRHGIQATSFVGPPGATASQRIPMNCAIWRYHPIHKKFEVVAEGGTNPWGFDYDEHGEMFMINTVIGHLFHIVPGARFRRMYGSHFNPHTYQVIEQTADHIHWDLGEPHTAASRKEGLSSGTDAAGGGHAHTGLMIYQGGTWPKKYHNALFTANFHGRRLNMDTIHREGNSYVGKHAADFMKTDDPWFRGVEMIYGPDGGVYVLDWSDIGECHENDGIHRTSGRIFKIVYGESKIDGNYKDLAKLDTNVLFGLLTHPNRWYSRTAQRLLAEKASINRLEIDQEILEFRKKLCSSNLQLNLDASSRLRNLWALYSIGMADNATLLKCTEHDSEHIRAWAVRLLTDGLRPINIEITKRLRELAKDESGLVRLYVATSLKRLDPKDRLTIASILCQTQSDAKDRVQPHLIWFGSEPVAVSIWQQAVKLAANSKIPLVRENIVRRLTYEIETKPEIVEAILTELENGNLEPVSTLRGMSLALDGWSNVKEPLNWPTVVRKLGKSENQEISQLVLNLGVVFGDGRAVADLKKIVTSNQADVAVRRRAIETWAATKPADLVDVLKGLIRDRSFTTSVVRAIVHSEDPSVANVIIRQMPHMDPEGKSTAINTLVSREPWALQLLQAAENGRINKDSITAYHAERIKQIGSPEIVAKLESVWGKVRETPEQKVKEIEALASKLSGPEQNLNSANLFNGRTLFKKNCASCHILFGEGGNTGPDLTGANRQNLNYLLTNIIDPSGSVAETYRSSVISLEDGRLLSGLILIQDRKTVRVQTPEEVITIDRDLIDEIRSSNKSVMPDALLNNMSFPQKVDLLGYLMSPTQISESK